MAVALDCSSAFECVYGDILLNVLEAKGAGPNFLHWTSDYMQGRYQYVEYNGARSAKWAIDSLPQGSVMSPDFYGAIASTFPQWDENNDSFCWVDDSVKIIAAPSVAECHEKGISATAHFEDWFAVHKLTLNANKSVIMGFGYTPNPITVGGVVVEAAADMRFLGTNLLSD